MSNEKILSLCKGILDYLDDASKWREGNDSCFIFSIEIKKLDDKVSLSNAKLFVSGKKDEEK